MPYALHLSKELRAVPVLALLLAASGEPARAQVAQAAPPGAPESIVVLSDDNYPPYSFRDDNGRLQGILPDQWALWQAKTGVRVEFKGMEWALAQQAMQAREGDVLDTIFRTPEREALYNFTPPYATIEVPIFAHESLSGLTDATTLKGFTIGAKAGDAVIDRLRAHGIESIKEYPSYEAIVRAAKADEIKVFTEDEPSAIYYLHKNGIASAFRQSFVIYTGQMHRAVAKDNPAVLQLVQSGFNQITPREYHAIDRKWMGTPFRVRDTFRNWLPVLFAIAGIISILAAGNVVLRHQIRVRTTELHRAIENLRHSLLERQKTAEELKASREYFANIFNILNDAILVLDADTFALLNANARTAEMFGFPSREAVLSADFSALLLSPPYSMAQVSEWCRKAKSDGPQVYEWQMKHADGHILCLEIQIQHVYLGTAGRLIVTVRDIHERKQAEQERQRFERRLQETQRLERLGLLAGGLAHDFNNLLAAILGNMELAMMALPEDSIAREDIQAAILSTKGAADLVQQMLDYAGKGRFLVEPVDISVIIRDSMQFMHVSIAPNIRVHTHLAETLPRIDTDATQIRQVIMNLVINASESLQNRPGTIDITTGILDSQNIPPAPLYPNETLPPGPYVFIEVTDTGPGIPAEIRDRIFDPFYTTKFIGRGLGLPVVLGIMRSHKGAIQVESLPGHGTTFRVFFPEAHLPAQAARPATPGPAPVDWSGGGRLMLLVEDDPTVLDTGAKLLSGLGFKVLCASDGQHAIHLFRAQAANIAGIILDLTLPHIDGAHALTEFRAIRANVPVIVSSGHSESVVMERFAGLKLDGFLPKPYTLEGLRNTLCQVLP